LETSSSIFVFFRHGWRYEYGNRVVIPSPNSKHLEMPCQRRRKSTLFNYPAMYVGVIAMSLLGFGMYYAVDWAEWRLCKWKFVG